MFAGNEAFNGIVVAIEKFDLNIASCRSSEIYLQNISVKFDDDQILDNLSLDINEKEFVTYSGGSKRCL